MIKPTTLIILVLYLTTNTFQIHTTTFANSYKPSNIVRFQSQNSKFRKTDLQIYKICDKISDFNGTKSRKLLNGYKSLEDAVRNSVVISSTETIVLKSLQYDGKNSMVRIQTFTNFDLDDLEFWASDNELKNIHFLNEITKENDRGIYNGVKKLRNLMVINLYGCVYDEVNFKIYYFIDKLFGTLRNQRDNLLTQNNYERFFEYRVLIFDIRKIHTQLKKIHLDISPDNIMYKNILLNENGKPDDFERNRGKFVDYGLMSDINSEVKVFNAFYAHPDLINKPNTKAQPYLDIFSLLLTFAEIEYGTEYITVADSCYQNYTRDCFNDLKKKIVKGYCMKLKQDIYLGNNLTDSEKKNKCGTNIESYATNYIPAKTCDDLACFIFKTIHLDGRQMQDRLDRDNNNSEGQDNIIAKDIGEVMDASPDNFFTLMRNAMQKNTETEDLLKKNDYADRHNEFKTEYQDYKYDYNPSYKNDHIPSFNEYDYKKPFDSYKPSSNYFNKPVDSYKPSSNYYNKPVDNYYNKPVESYQPLSKYDFNAPFNAPSNYKFNKILLI